MLVVETILWFFPILRPLCPYFESLLKIPHPYMRTSLLRTRCCTWFVSYLEQGKPNFSLQFKSPSDPFSHFIIGGPFLMVFKVILEYEWMSSSASHSFTGPLGPYSGDTFLSPWVSQPLFELRTGCMGGNQKMLNRKCPHSWDPLLILEPAVGMNFKNSLFAVNRCNLCCYFQVCNFKTVEGIKRL